MVKIRLQRQGAKKRPQYLIVATNETTCRDGQYLEKLGFYFPKSDKPENKVTINKDKFDAWIKNGAQMSLTVSQIVKYIK